MTVVDGLGLVLTVVGIIGGVFTLVAGFTFALAYIRASRTSAPVVKAMDKRIELAEQESARLKEQNDQQERDIARQDNEIAQLRELVTQAAKVDAFRTESATWRRDSAKEHEAQIDTLRRIAASLGVLTRTSIAMARQMGVPIRDTDEEL